VTQQAGNLIAGVEGSNIRFKQIPISTGSVAVPKAVVGHKACGIFGLDLGPHLAEGLLEAVDGKIGADAFIDRHGANLAALAFNGNSTFPERLFRSGGIQTETLMDAQTEIIRGRGDSCEVLMIGPLASQYEPIKFQRTPGAVHAAEAAVPQFHGQLIIGRQLVLRFTNLAVKETGAGPMSLS